MRALFGKRLHIGAICQCSLTWLQIFFGYVDICMTSSRLYVEETQPLY